MNTTPDTTALLSVPLAPRPRRVVRVSVDTQDGPDDLGLYSNFLSDVALIDRQKTETLPRDLDNALSQYAPKTADSVRMNFVADGPKLRRARQLVMAEFDSDQRKRARNDETKSSRQRCMATLSKYHHELDQLVGGRDVWLPAGVDVQSITYENILNIRKIVNFTLANTPGCDPASLWSPDGGVLSGVRYTGKHLAQKWAIMSRGQPRRGRPPQPPPADEDEWRTPSPPPDAGICDFSDEDRSAPVGTTNDSEWEDVEKEDERQPHMQDIALPIQRSPEASRRARQPADESRDEPELAKVPTNPGSLFSPRHPRDDSNLSVATPPMTTLTLLESETSSPPLPASSLRPKRSQSGQSPRPAKKRRTTETRQEAADLPTKPNADFSPASIAPGRYISDAFIYHVLNMIISLSPLSIQLVDSLLLKPDQPSLPARLLDQLTSRRDSVLIAPVNLTQRSKHWVLAVASGDTISIFDSLPGATDEAELRARLQSIEQCLRVRQLARNDNDAAATGITYAHEACAVQNDAVSCGVAVIVNALYVVAGVGIIPTNVPDYAVWRRVLAAFATGDGMTKRFGPSTAETVLPASSLSTPPLPPVGDLTQAQYLAWKRTTAAYSTSVKKALYNAKEQHAQAKNTLSAAAALFADVCKVGTGSWSPQLQKTRKSTDFIDEIQADYGRYLSAAKLLGSCMDAHPEIILKLENQMRDLRRLQDGRTAVLQRVSALAQALREEDLAIGRQAQDHDQWILEDGNAEE